MTAYTDNDETSATLLHIVYRLVDQQKCNSLDEIHLGHKTSNVNVSTWALEMRLAFFTVF